MDSSQKSTKYSPSTTEKLRQLQLKALFSVEEAANYLGLCPKTIRNHTNRGLIPHVRIGRFIKYRRVALDALLARLEKGGKV